MSTRSSVPSTRALMGTMPVPRPEEPLLVRLHARQVVLLDRRRSEVAAVELAPQPPRLARRAHECAELLGEEALEAVGLGDQRVRVRLDQHDRGARHDTGEGGGMDQVADARAVRGVYRDREPRELVAVSGDRAAIEGVSRVAVGARDAALAEEHLLLAAGH